MEEMAAILGHLPVELLTLDAFPEIGDIPEKGVTLKENAFIKAETVHKITGLPALADDTGLEVDALNGDPGVYSARYAGENATFEDNCNKMLSKLDGFPMEERRACFRTVIAFVTVDKNKPEQVWLKRFRNRYKRVLWWALDHRWTVVAVTLITLVGVSGLYWIVGKGLEFFPETEPNQAYIDVTAATGTKLEVSDEVIREIEASMGSVVDLVKYVSNVGSSPDPDAFSGGGGGGTPHKSRVITDFPERADRSRSSFETVEEMRGYLEDLVGARVEVVLPRRGPPTGPPINIELIGEDFKVLGRLTKEGRPFEDRPFRVFFGETPL